MQGFRAELTATVRRSSRDLASDRAVVIAQALLDLLLRWPLAEPQIRVTVDGERVRRTHDITWLQPYEIGVILAGGPGLPRTQLSVDRETPPRIELLWSQAMSLPVARLNRLLGPLSQASSAAAARHPFDRVVPLWSAMELLYPGPRTDLPESTRSFLPIRPLLRWKQLAAIRNWRGFSDFGANSPMTRGFTSPFARDWRHPPARLPTASPRPQSLPTPSAARLFMGNGRGSVTTAGLRQGPPRVGCGNFSNARSSCDSWADNSIL